MKHNTKKGFTLVELLVVIAILAILATVSVVGYTSFIESTNVAVDENLAGQLNNFLAAYKVNNTEEITADNIREVTAEIMVLGGLEELVPKALKNGYNFYYDLEEGKYVVMEDKKVQNSGMHYFINIFADDASEYEVKLENSFTQGNRYFLVGTATPESALLQLVDGVYNFDSTNAANLLSLATKTGIQEVIDFMNSAVIVTKDCNYRLGSNPTHVIFVEGVTAVGTTTKQWNGSSWNEVTADVLVSMNNGFFTVPNSVQFLAKDSLNATGTTIVFKKSASEVAKMAFECFTDVPVKTKDGNYTVKDNGTGENADKAVITNGTVEYVLEYYNPANSFEVNVTEQGDKQVYNSQETDGTKFAYVSWDLTSFDTFALNMVGSINPSLPSSTQDNEVRWTISDNTLATIDATTGLVTFTDVQPTAENCTFTVTGTVNGVSASINIKVVAVYGATVTIAGKDVTASSTHTLVFGNDVEGQNGTYTLATSNVQKTFTTSEIVLNEKVTISTDKVVVGDNTITVAEGVEGTVEETVTVKYGKFTVAANKKLTLFDAANLPFAIKNANLKYVGNSNNLKASDFFVAKDDEWAIPSNVTLMVYEGASNTDLLDTNRATITTDTDSSFYVSDDSVVGFETEFKFTGTRTSGPAYLCLVIDGVIVSPDIPVTTVNGYNVRTATQSDIDWKAGKQSYVLLNKVELWKGGDKTNSANYIVIGENQTLWGNLFELNIQNGYYKDNDSSNGIIGLWGVIRDTKIVGDTYTSFGVSVENNYGASAIDSKSNAAQIINSYVSGCRSPLRLDSSITVTDSVFFGGRYANIDIVGPYTLTLNGTNYTVNQGYGGAVGVGIAAWFNDNVKTVVNNGTLKQYNFISDSNKSQLTSIDYTILGQGVKINLKDLFGKILGDSSYDAFKFYSTSDTAKSNPYVNAAFLCLDYNKTGSLEMSGVNDYLGQEQSVELCGSLIWRLVGSTMQGRCISDRNMPNKVWTPNPAVYGDLFAESQNTTYMNTFKPENFELSWN